MQLQKDNKMVFCGKPAAICPNWQQSKFSLENYQAFNLLERRNWDAMHSRHSSNCPLNCWDAHSSNCCCRPNSCSETVVIKNQSVNNSSQWWLLRFEATGASMPIVSGTLFLKKYFFKHFFVVWDLDDPFFDCFWMRSSSCTHANKKYS